MDTRKPTPSIPHAMTSIRHGTPSRAAPILLVLLAACGGGTTDPPPPPPPASPGSVTRSAGDQQQAAAGTAVAVAPAVLVRNSEGQPMAGVAVTFAVVEGGGSVGGATPTTDASGLAAAGQWVLGLSGPQRLTATVGALPAVDFLATLSPGTEQTVSTLGAGGGSVVLTGASHPYTGLTLTIPAGVFTEATEWRMRALPSELLPAVPNGFTVVGPLLEIITTAPRGEDLMVLDIPFVSDPGEGVAVMLRDPLTGVLEVLPTVSRTATSVRVATSHLRADLLTDALSSGAPAAAPLAATGPTGSHLVRLKVRRRTRPTVAPVMTGASRWPVVDHGSAQFPEGYGPAMPMLTALGRLNQASTWNALGTSGIHFEQSQFAVVELAARAGARTHMLNILMAYYSNPNPEEQAQLAVDQVVAKTGITQKPAVMAMMRNAAPPAPGEVVYLTAIGVNNDVISAIDPADVTRGIRQIVVNDPGGVVPVNLAPTADGVPVQTSVMVPMSSFLLPFPEVQALVTRLEAARAASGVTRKQLEAALMAEAGIPAVQAELEAEPGGGWVPAGDTVVVRSLSALFRLSGLGGQVSTMLLGDPVTGTEVARTTGPGSLPVAMLPGLSGLANGGSAQFAAVTSTILGGHFRQLGGILAPFIKAPFEVTPTTQEMPTDRKVTFTASVPRPPAGWSIEWTWGDNTAPTTSAALTIDHTYQNAGDYTVIARLKEGGTGRLLAADTVEVTGTPLPFWRITAISDLDEIIDAESDFSNELIQMLQRVFAEPTSGLLAVEPANGTTEFRLRVRRTDTWGPTLCCPPPTFNGASEFVLTLGTDPPLSHPVGPYFAGWESTSWSQSTTDPAAGTMTAQSISGQASYNIQNGGTQTGPAGGWRTTATRNGTTMTGMITLTIWWVGGPDDEVQGSESFRIPFTAERMK